MSTSDATLRPSPVDIVKVYPELSLAALQDKRDRELCLWYELRALNPSGDGNLDRLAAIAALVTESRYTRRTLYRILGLGEGVFWVRGASRRGPRIFLKSLRQVAISLRVGRLSRHPQNIPAPEFVGRAKRRAWLYASFFAPDGVDGAKPISRESIARATGVQRRQQIRYDNQVRILKMSNFGVHDVHVLGTNNHMRLSLRQWVIGKSKAWWMTRRLGNTYWTGATEASLGMVRKVNSLLADGLETGARPNVPRRFFTTAKAFLRCPVRHEEPFLKVPQGETLVASRREWCLAINTFGF